jgi:hypothetical protein
MDRLFDERQLFPINSRIIPWMRKNIVSNLCINKSTKITSIGSCFAREIRNWFIRNNFNYLIGENKKVPWESAKVFKGDKGKQPFEHSSIAWERVYNTFTLRHIIDYTFNQDRLTDRLLRIHIKGVPYISDIIRNRILYKDIEIANQDILFHIENSKNILCNTDILIVTLGLTEIWESKTRGIVAAANPYKHYELPNDFMFRTSSYQENIENLNYIYDVLKKHNETIKILITVSPVSLLETYRKDVDVITANCESKSILRAVAGDFSHNKDVYYFPSYEIATVGSIFDNIIMTSDGHHISQELVDMIMNIFEINYVKN